MQIHPLLLSPRGSLNVNKLKANCVMGLRAHFEKGLMKSLQEASSSGCMA